MSAAVSAAVSVIATTPVDDRVARAWHVLAGVSDPEIPVISVVDLGIVRAIDRTAHGLDVRVTPNYAGCPATHVIEAAIGSNISALSSGSLALIASAVSRRTSLIRRD